MRPDDFYSRAWPKWLSPPTPPVAYNVRSGEFIRCLGCDREFDYADEWETHICGWLCERDAG